MYIESTQKSIFDAVSSPTGEGEPATCGAGGSLASEGPSVTPTSNKGGNGQDYSTKGFYEYSVDWLSFTLPMIDKDFVQSSILVDVGQRIKHERELANKSIKDLANELRVSYFFLRKVEDGEIPPGIMFLSMIAKALDKPYRYFIPDPWLKGLHASVLERLGDYTSLTDLPAPNLKGYDNTFFMFPAGRAAWHSQHPENKFLVQFSGQDLAQLREFGIDIIEMINWFVAIGGTCTRLDIAIDAFNIGSVSDFIDQWAERLVYLESYDRYERQDIPLDQRGLITPAQSSQVFIESSAKGYSQTFYLGSQHSERRLRVYDKFYETQCKAAKVDTSSGVIPPSMPAGVTSWVRIELTLRKSYADNAACALALADDLQSFISTLVSDYCDAPAIPWYQAALQQVADIVVEPVRRKITNTEQWLLTQVLPSVKRLAKMGSQSVLTLANSALEEFFNSEFVYIETGIDRGLLENKTYFVDLAGAY